MERYLELVERVDAFFARVFEAHRAEMQCGSGCSDCCHSRFSVTLVEAAWVAHGLARLDADRRAQLASRARTGDPDVCPALDDDGRCAVYQVRPLICRSHGAPIRKRRPDSLPVVEVCARNFTAGGLESVADADVFDQETVSTVLAAVDAAFSDAAGAPRGVRIELADLLADPDQFFQGESDDEADHA